MSLFRRRPDAPPVIPSWDRDLDGEKRADLAMRLIFTTEPTDRALAGWSCLDWVEAMTAGDGNGR